MAPRLQTLRAEVIADIIRIAGTLRSGRLLTRKRYLIDAGSRFSAEIFEELGGWLSLCREAGVRGSPPPQKVLPKVRPDRKTLRRAIIDDIARVAAAIGLAKNAPFSERVYHERGGCYSQGTIQQFGWMSLCRKAGMLAKRGYHRRQLKPKPDPTDFGTTRSFAQLDAALDQLLGRIKRRKGMPCLMSNPRGVRRKFLASNGPPLERSDAIADLRDIALRLGLSAPRLLTWETYHVSGGQYRFEQFLRLGGFDSLRRAA
jgi:hypothetical protein